jgi:hypothetical protein
VTDVAAEVEGGVVVRVLDGVVAVAPEAGAELARAVCL